MSDITDPLARGKGDTRILRPLKRLAVGPRSGKNRREGKRYFTTLVFCQVLPPALPAGAAEVVNLSARGVCLRLDAQVAPGDLLLLRLSNRNQLYIHEVTLRVTHSVGASGLCLAGGKFVNELSLEVFRSLLA